MPENKKFNDPQKQEIYDLLIEAGVKPAQAFQIAIAPNSPSLSDEALIVLSQVVTDDNGYYVVNQNNVGGALGQNGNITDMVNYFASEEGATEATNLISDQVNYITAVESRSTYNDRIKAYNTAIKDYAKRREEAEAKADNAFLTDEAKARAQANLAQFDAEREALNNQAQDLNNEYQTFVDWGLEGTRTAQREGFTPRPALSRVASTYDERGLRGASGNYYLSKDQMEWGEQNKAELAAQQASEETGAPAVQYQQDKYNNYRQLGGGLSFENWAKAGQPISAPESMSTIYSRNIPTNLSYNEANWRRNAYSDIYGEFLASQGAPPADETSDQQIMRETNKAGAFEDFVKKYNFTQKYKGVTPYARGENTGRLAPRARTLSY